MIETLNGVGVETSPKRRPIEYDHFSLAVVIALMRALFGVFFALNEFFGTEVIETK